MVEYSAAAIASIEVPTTDMLKWDQQRADAFELAYDPKWDVLFIREKVKRPALSLPVESAWLRYDPRTLEVLGVEIEDFEGAFLANHPNLRADWEQVKPYVTKQRRSMVDELMKQIAALIGKVLEWLGKPPDIEPSLAMAPA